MPDDGAGLALDAVERIACTSKVGRIGGETGNECSRRLGEMRKDGNQRCEVCAFEGIDRSCQSGYRPITIAVQRCVAYERSQMKMIFIGAPAFLVVALSFSTPSFPQGSSSTDPTPPSGSLYFKSETCGEGATTCRLKCPPRFVPVGSMHPGWPKNWGVSIPLNLPIAPEIEIWVPFNQGIDDGGAERPLLQPIWMWCAKP